MENIILNWRLYKSTKVARKWIVTHQFQLALFNGFLMLMILLRSAGYFAPFVPITINLIFASALVLSVFLLGTNSMGAVGVALIFWGFASLLRILGIEVWADRAAVYSFEALSLGILLFVIEEVKASFRRDNLPPSNKAKETK